MSMYGVSVKFVNTDTVTSNGSVCSGYFDHNKRLIVIATKYPDVWPQVFIHEYCHFLQWSGTGKRFFQNDYDIDDWLNGKIELSLGKEPITMSWMNSTLSEMSY